MFRLTPYNSNQIVKRRDDFSDLYNLFDGFWNDSFFGTQSIGTGSFKVDIKDNEDAYVIEAELPGVAKDEITVDYRDDLLTIKVEKEEINDDNTQYIHKERRQTKLQRVFRMKGVNREGLKAKLENGILVITAPKRDEVINGYKVEVE